MNLIIDGNAFLNVSVNIVKRMMENDKSIGKNYWVEDLLNDGFVLKEIAKTMFKDFSLKYLNSIISINNNVDYVYVVFDSKSWRKTYLETEDVDIRDVEYKGNRKYDDMQPLFYEFFRLVILDEIIHTNILSHKVDGAEGDDIICRVLELYPTEDFCIWSVDLDFSQLLSNTPRRVILSTPKMSKKTKNIYTSINYNESLKSSEFNSLDFSFNHNKDHVLDFTKKGYGHIEVNPNEELITKLIAGDKSDNVPRAHKGMTPKKMEIIVPVIMQEFDNFIEILDRTPTLAINYITDSIFSLLKLKDEDELLSIKESLKVNIRLMRLNSRFAPKDIIKNIDDSIKNADRQIFLSNELKKHVKY